MVVCPVCEHQQDAEVECEACGTPLRARSERGAGPAPALEDLERTAIAPAGTPAETPEPLPDLQPTGHEAGGSAEPEDVSAWIERCVPPTSIEVVVEPLEVERIAPQRRDAPRRAPPELSCRYCRTVLPADETFCPRCGVKVAVRWEQEREAGEARRCRFCGGMGQGAACPACGARFSSEGD